MPGISLNVPVRVDQVELPGSLPLVVVPPDGETRGLFQAVGVSLAGLVQVAGVGPCCCDCHWFAVVVVASLRLLALSLFTCRGMRWIFLLFLYICRGMTPVTGQPAADTAAGPGPHQLASVSLRLARAGQRFPVALCGNTATQSENDSHSHPTLVSW